MLIEGAARQPEVYVDKASVMRPPSSYHHIVDRGWQVAEEPLERSRIRGIEGCGAQASSSLTTFWRRLGSRPMRITLAPSVLALQAVSSPIPALPPDHNDGLPKEFRLALTGKRVRCGAHDSSEQLSKFTGVVLWVRLSVAGEAGKSSGARPPPTRLHPSFRQLSAGLLGHHVRGVPVGPVLVALPGAFLVLAVGGRGTFECARQVACGAE